MHRLRKLPLTLLVWLTAAMTVAAGTPRFVCGCPKLQSVRFANKPTECCCGGRCRAGSCPYCEGDPLVRRARASTCCGKESRATSGAQKATPSLSTCCCTKSPAQSAPAASTSSGTSLAKQVVLGLSRIQDELASQRCSLAFCRHHPEGESPPPTDLVIAFQHFLI